jgi:hypothetical protein
MNMGFQGVILPAVHGNTYLSWWWSSVNIMNIVSFTCAHKQDICYSSVSSNALNVMVYELLNPMFCMSLCLQLLILHTNCVLKIC